MIFVMYGGDDNVQLICFAVKLLCMILMVDYHFNLVCFVVK